jgi:hypothetical protein
VALLKLPRPLRAIVFASVAFALALSSDPAAATDDAPNTIAMPATQFVDKTYVSLPKTVGDYSLLHSAFDPEQLAAGVSSTYALEGAPEQFTISLFVYPQGRSDVKAAVEAQIAEVEQAIREQGQYTKVEAGPRTAFVIAAPAPTALPNQRNGREQRVLSGPPVKVSAEAIDNDYDNDNDKDNEPTLEQLLQDSKAPLHSAGRHQNFTYAYQGANVRSAGLVFHRNLYNLKLRISAPADVVNAARFGALVEATARALVPKVDIRNFGLCGQMLVQTQESGDKTRDALALARQMLREQGRVARENCAESEGPTADPVDEGYERTEIVYPPGIWRSDNFDN